MRKTLCMNCMKVWEESYDIPLEESSCPNCGTPALKNRVNGQNQPSNIVRKPYSNHL